MIEGPTTPPPNTDETLVTDSAALPPAEQVVELTPPTPETTVATTPPVAPDLNTPPAPTVETPAANTQTETAADIDDIISQLTTKHEANPTPPADPIDRDAQTVRDIYELSQQYGLRFDEVAQLFTNLTPEQSAALKDALQGAELDQALEQYRQVSDAMATINEVADAANNGTVVDTKLSDDGNTLEVTTKDPATGQEKKAQVKRHMMVALFVVADFALFKGTLTQQYLSQMAGSLFNKYLYGEQAEMLDEAQQNNIPGAEKEVLAGVVDGMSPEALRQHLAGASAEQLVNLLQLYPDAGKLLNGQPFGKRQPAHQLTTAEVSTLILDKLDPAQQQQLQNLLPTAGPTA